MNPQYKTVSLSLCPVAREVIDQLASIKHCSKGKALESMIRWASNHWAPGAKIITARHPVIRQQTSYYLSETALAYLTMWARARDISIGRAAEEICIAIALRGRMKHGK